VVLWDVKRSDRGQGPSRYWQSVVTVATSPEMLAMRRWAPIERRPRRRREYRGARTSCLRGDMCRRFSCG
jgi:hypothetical protein